MKGFSLFGAIIVIAVAGVLSMGIPVLVGQNQSLRMAQHQIAQAYWSDRGALEFAQRQILIEGNPTPLPTRYFKNSMWNFTRSGGQVQVSTTQGSAVTSLTMDEPKMARYLIVDMTTAARSGTDIINITLQQRSGAASDITISSMVMTWSGLGSRRVTGISINSILKFSGSVASGGTCALTGGGFTFSGTTVYPLTYIRYNNNVPGSAVSIKFNMSDGSSKTVTLP